MPPRLPLIEVRDIVKHFGSVIALSGVSMKVSRGEVHVPARRQRRRQVDADQDAVRRASSRARASSCVDGKPVAFASPRDALDAGIATVYQDLAMIPLMSITRNFFMGREPARGFGPFRCDRLRALRRRDARGDAQDRHRHPRSAARRSARCRAASANASRSRARSISAPRC